MEISFFLPGPPIEVQSCAKGTPIAQHPRN